MCIMATSPSLGVIKGQVHHAPCCAARFPAGTYYCWILITNSSHDSCWSVLDQDFEPLPPHSVRVTLDKSVSCTLEMQMPKLEGEHTLCTSNTFIHSANVLVQLEPHHSLSVWDFLLFQWSGSRQAERAKREAEEIKWTIYSTWLIKADRGWINKEKRLVLEKKEEGSATSYKNILPRLEISFIPALVSRPFNHSIHMLFTAFYFYRLSSNVCFCCQLSSCVMLVQFQKGCLFPFKMTNTNFTGQNHKIKVHWNTFGQTTPTADWF